MAKPTVPYCTEISASRGASTHEARALINKSTIRSVWFFRCTVGSRCNLCGSRLRADPWAVFFGAELLPDERSGALRRHFGPFSFATIGPLATELHPMPMPVQQDHRLNELLKEMSALAQESRQLAKKHDEIMQRYRELKREFDRLTHKRPV